MRDHRLPLRAVGESQRNEFFVDMQRRRWAPVPSPKDFSPGNKATFTDFMTTLRTSACSSSTTNPTCARCYELTLLAARL